MKLTTKLILAFLLVSLFSTGIIVVFTRVATNREFDKFVNDQYKTELVEQLASYYEENKTWDGVEKLFTTAIPMAAGRPLFFSIADTNGKIVVAGMDRHPGEIVSADELKAGTPIQVNDETVGFLLINTPPDKKSARR